MSTLHDATDVERASQKEAYQHVEVTKEEAIVDTDAAGYVDSSVVIDANETKRLRRLINRRWVEISKPQPSHPDKTQQGPSVHDRLLFVSDDGQRLVWSCQHHGRHAKSGSHRLIDWCRVTSPIPRCMDKTMR